MNRRGFLLAEETLKIIIGVIAIGFLVYLLVSIYLSSNESRELEQAKETLSRILDEANAGKATVDVYNPKGWSILFLNNELCICEKEFCTNQVKACRQSDFTVPSQIKIDNPPVTLIINQEDKLLSKK